METAGSKLKKIRQEQGLSLEEAHKKTKIHLNILKAIEGDSLTDLSPVYLKGFLKIYCKFLGVDPKDYVPDYRETQSKLADAVGNKKFYDKPKESSSFFETASLKLNSVRETAEKFKKTIVFVSIAIIILLGMFKLGKSIAYKFRQKPGHAFQGTRPSANVPKTQESVSLARHTAAGVTQASSGIEASSAKKKEIPPAIRLGIKARENCWVSVKTDSRLVFQSVLEKGRSKFWNAKEKIELSLGNAGVVELEVNGQIFSNLGRRGQSRKNILITKEGMNIGR